jgi:spore coat polysaccharide biosynthesis protein SpsF
MTAHTPVVAIQARLSSSRFPGKVLAKLQGRTVIEHVTDCFHKMGLPCFVLTSEDVSDNPLVEYLQGIGQDVFRGPLDDVLSRFRFFARNFSFSHIIRVSGDSPLLHPEVAWKVVSGDDIDTFDVITNIFPRTFPKGQSVEMLKTETFEALSSFPLLSTHREHVTSFIYENPDIFRISNRYNDLDVSSLNMCVDYPDDLERLAKMLELFNISISDGFPSWPELCQLLTSRSW